MRAAPKAFVFRVVGTTFSEGYPANVDRILDMLTAGPVPARFQRVHDNPHDPHAVAVVCDAVGGRIGWVPRVVAARIAPALDGGATYHVEIGNVVIHPDHPQNPGIDALAELLEDTHATREPA